MFRHIILSVGIAFASLVQSTVTIDVEKAKDIEDSLSSMSEGSTYSINSSGDIILNAAISWKTSACLELKASGDIIIKSSANVHSHGLGCLILMAGMGNDTDALSRRGHITIENRENMAVQMGSGKIQAYYVPEQSNKEHKYHNPGLPILQRHVECQSTNCLTSYMLVDTADDLQNINRFLSGNYALSRSIDLKSLPHFSPLKNDFSGRRGRPFSGQFDGNGFTISGLQIDLPDQDKVGLFGMCGGFNTAPARIKHLTLARPFVRGNTYVGSVVGWATFCHLSDVKVLGPTVVADDIAGGVVGTGLRLQLENIVVDNVTVKTNLEHHGDFTGTCNTCELKNVVISETDFDDFSSTSVQPLSKNYLPFAKTDP